MLDAGLLHSNISMILHAVDLGADINANDALNRSVIQLAEAQIKGNPSLALVQYYISLGYRVRDFDIEKSSDDMIRNFLAVMADHQRMQARNADIDIQGEHQNKIRL